MAMKKTKVNPVTASMQPRGSSMRSCYFLLGAVFNEAFWRSARGLTHSHDADLQTVGGEDGAQLPAVSLVRDGAGKAGPCGVHVVTPVPAAAGPQLLLRGGLYRGLWT